MEDFVRQRIKEVLDHYNTNPTKLSKGDSALQVRLSRQLKLGAAVTSQTITFILNEFPKVSAEWLLRGVGEMFIENVSYFPSSLGEDSDKYEVSVQNLKEKIISLEAENKVLREVAGLQREREQKGKSA